MKEKKTMILRVFTALIVTLTLAAPAAAAQCGGNFNAFLGQMAREAQSAGVSRAVVAQAFAGLSPDQRVLAFDRRQAHAFRREGNFEVFIKTRVGTARVNRAAKLMRRHAALLSRIERQFGVPKELLVAIWTMESDNGTGDMGKLPVIRTQATLAWDCRRTELFQRELIAALQDPPARRPAAARTDRRLCRRDRPDPVPAVVLHQVRRRL